MKNQWLKDLEDKVEATVAEVARLREENDALRTTIGDLEEAAKDPQETNWQEERAEVRERVGRIVETLESTLEALP